MKYFKIIGRVAFIILVYLFVFLYAIIFTNDTGWVLFIFFSLLFLFECLSLISPLRMLKVKNTERIHLTVNEKKSINLVIGRAMKLPLYFDTLRVTFPEIQQYRALTNYFGQEKMLQIDWEPSQRGVIENQSLFLQTSDFFRLFIKQREMILPVEWIVLPEKHPLINEAIAVIEKVTNKKAYGETSYTLKNYREYREGESTKLIDWKTSSRMETLMTREYERDEPIQWLFVFYGIESTHFEALLSLFYTLFRTYKTSARFMLIGADGANSQLDSLVDFSKVQPVGSIPEIPYRQTESVCVFVPELSETLTRVFHEKRFHLISYEILVGKGGATNVD